MPIASEVGVSQLHYCIVLLIAMGIELLIPPIGVRYRHFRRARWLRRVAQPSAPPAKAMRFQSFFRAHEVFDCPHFLNFTAHAVSRFQKSRGLHEKPDSSG